MLEQDITKKEQVNELSKLKPELNIGANNKYKVEVIRDSVFYIDEIIGSQLPGLYYHVS